MKIQSFSTIRVLCVLAIAALLGACRHDSPIQPPASTNDCCHGVIGILALDSAGNHISGAAVTLNGTTTDGTTVTRGPETTNGDGATAFRELCPGRYEIHAAKDGYHTASTVIEMTCNDTTHATMTLFAVPSNTTTGDCHSGRITLEVHDSATNALITGGTANLYHNGHLVSSKAMGTTAVWEGLDTGAYSFSLSHDGYAPVEFAVEPLSCNQHRSAGHTMAALHDCCNGVVELSITDASTTHPLGAASVTMTRSGMTTLTATSTDNGSVRFGSLCTGNYRMVVHRDGYVDTVIEFAETCNATHGYPVALNAVHTDNCCTAIMSMHVEDSVHHDTVLAGATVTIRIDGNNDNLRTGTTTDGGNYTTDGLCGHTTYIVTISKDGYNSRTFHWQFTDCHTYTETFLLGHQ